MGVFKRRPRKVSPHERRRKLRTEYLEKARQLKERLSSREHPETHFKELVQLSRDFFHDFFQLRYEPTNQELIAELQKRKLKEEIRKPIVEHLEHLTSLSYSPEQNITTKGVEDALDQLIPLIDAVYEAAMGVAPKKAGMRLNPLEPIRDLWAGFAVIWGWGKLALTSVGKGLTPSRMRSPEDRVAFIMEELTRGYGAIEARDMRKAERSLERIMNELEHLSLDELSEVETEVKTFRLEVRRAFEEHRPLVPESSVPEAGQRAPRAEAHAEPAPAPEEHMTEEHMKEPAEEDVLERFVRLALEHRIEPPHIRKRLLENGWSEHEVDEVFRRLSLS